MKFLTKTARLLREAFMHYVCMRLKFRSSVVRASLSQQMTDICLESCCPLKP